MGPSAGYRQQGAQDRPSPASARDRCEGFVRDEASCAASEAIWMIAEAAFRRVLADRSHRPRRRIRISASSPCAARNGITR